MSPRAIAKRFEVVGAEWVAQRCMSYETLLEQLISLDYLSTRGLDAHAEGTVPQWAPVFKKCPEGWSLVTLDEEQIVGYWSFFSLSDVLQRALETGDLLDSQITASNVHRMREPREHVIYIVMITHHPSYSWAKKRIFRLLMRSLAQRLCHLVDGGATIQRIFANAYTSEGLRLCETLGFSASVAAKQGGTVYSANLDGVLLERLRRLAKA